MHELPKGSDVKHIGMRRARALSNLSPKKQLDIIAEGLPILMESAGGLFDAANELSDHPRSAAVLRGQALEEVAKILILVDLVRCPTSQRSSRVGAMTKWFYDHLARLLYVEAQSWKPMHLRQLQEYVDGQRVLHYLEGEFGEYIIPNYEIYRRESDLYADVFEEEDGTLHWNDPQSTYHDPVDSNALVVSLSNPASWRVCKALRDFGAFSRQGLEIVSTTWSKIDFKDVESYADTRTLTFEMMQGLEKANLIADEAKEGQLGALYNAWQLPMYRVNFSAIKVSLQELQDERDRSLAYYQSY